MAKQIKYKPCMPLNLCAGAETLNSFGIKYNHEIAHIYDLLNAVSSFYKVGFTTNSNWVKQDDDCYKLTVNCKDYVALGVFRSGVNGAPDERVVSDINVGSGIVEVSGVTPYNGYIVVAYVNDDDGLVRTNKYVDIDDQLDKESSNLLPNRVVANAIEELNAKIDSMGNCCQPPMMPPATPMQVPPHTHTVADIVDFHQHIHHMHPPIYPPMMPPAPPHQCDCQVADWAKAPEKPCYTWDEICGKPTLVQKIRFEGKALKNNKGVVDLDPIIESIELPKKLSDLENDLSLSKFKDDLGIATKFKYLDSIDASVKIQIKDIQDKNSALFDKMVEGDQALKNQIKQNFDSLKEYVDTNREECHKECQKAITAVDTKATTEINKLKEEDKILHADISRFVHACTQLHMGYDIKIDELEKAMAELEDKMPTEDYEGLLDKVNSAVDKVDDFAAALEALQNAFDEYKTTNDAFQTNVRNNLSTIKSTLTKNTADIKTNTENIAQNTADIKTNTENITKNAEDIAKLKEDVAGLDEKLDGVSDAVDELKEGLEGNISDAISEAISEAVGDLGEDAEGNPYENVKEFVEDKLKDIDVTPDNDTYLDWATEDWNGNGDDDSVLFKQIAARDYVDADGVAHTKGDVVKDIEIPLALDYEIKTASNRSVVTFHTQGFNIIISDKDMENLQQEGYFTIADLVAKMNALEAKFAEIEIQEGLANQVVELTQEVTELNQEVVDLKQEVSDLKQYIDDVAIELIAANSLTSNDVKEAFQK